MNSEKLYAEKRNLREYIHSGVCTSLKVIQENCPEKKFGKKYSYRKLFIDSTMKRVKETFEDYFQNPFTNKVRFERVNYGSGGANLMFCHLEKIEQKMLKFLQNTSSDLTDDFKETCLEQARKCIEDAYDIFADSIGASMPKPMCEPIKSVKTSKSKAKTQNPPEIASAVKSVFAESSNNSSTAGWISNGPKKNKLKLNILTEANGAERNPKHPVTSPQVKQPQQKRNAEATSVLASMLTATAKATVRAKATASATNADKTKQKAASASTSASARVPKIVAAKDKTPAIPPREENAKSILTTTSKATSTPIQPPEQTPKRKISLALVPTKRKNSGDQAVDEVNPKRGKDMPILTCDDSNEKSALIAETPKKSSGSAVVKRIPNQPEKPQPDTTAKKTQGAITPVVPKLRIARVDNNYMINRTNTPKTNSTQITQTESGNRNAIVSKSLAGETNRDVRVQQPAAPEGAQIVSTERVNVNLELLPKNAIAMTTVPNSHAAQPQIVQAAKTSRAGELKFHCYYCKAANEPISAYINEKSVLNHWQTEHANQSKPYLIYVEEMASCGHCDYFGLWSDLLEHHSEVHPTSPLIVTNGNDREKCAFCEFKGDDLLQHLQAEHRDTLQNPRSESLRKNNGYMKMSESNLNKVLANNNKDEAIRFVCSNNRQLVILNREDVLDHLQEHGIYCSYDQFKTKSLFDYLMHKRDVHGKNDFEIYRPVFQNWLKKEFLKMGALFPNGVILSNGNLDGKNFKHFHDFLDDLMDFMQMLMSEAAMKHLLKIVVCYVPGEDVKQIFGNLRRRLELQINDTDIVKLERSESKRSIVVEFRNPRIKERIVEKVNNEIIFTSELISGTSAYELPPNTHTKVQFEF